MIDWSRMTRKEQEIIDYININNNNNNTNNAK